MTVYYDAADCDTIEAMHIEGAEAALFANAIGEIDDSQLVDRLDWIGFAITADAGHRMEIEALDSGDRVWIEC